VKGGSLVLHAGLVVGLLILGVWILWVALQQRPIDDPNAEWRVAETAIMLRFSGILVGTAGVLGLATLRARRGVWRLALAVVDAAVAIGLIALAVLVSPGDAPAAFLSFSVLALIASAGAVSLLRT